MNTSEYQAFKRWDLEALRSRLNSFEIDDPMPKSLRLIMSEFVKKLETKKASFISNLENLKLTQIAHTFVKNFWSTEEFYVEPKTFARNFKSSVEVLMIFESSSRALMDANTQKFKINFMQAPSYFQILQLQDKDVKQFYQRMYQVLSTDKKYLRSELIKALIDYREARFREGPGFKLFGLFHIGPTRKDKLSAVDKLLQLLKVRVIVVTGPQRNYVYLGHQAPQPNVKFTYDELHALQDTRLGEIVDLFDRLGILTIPPENKISRDVINYHRF